MAQYQSLYTAVLSLLLLIKCSSCENRFPNINAVIGDVRLLTDNRLEICYAYNSESQCIWSSFCHEKGLKYFNKAAAAVACRQLGFITNKGDIVGTNNGVNEVSYSAICPTVSNYILYGEYHLLRCKVEKINNYTCTTAVALYCDKQNLQDYQPYKFEGQVYLSDSDIEKSQSYGKVLTRHNGQWLQVCHENFNNETADSVCRQLGYTNAITWKLSDTAESKGWLFASFKRCTNSSLPCFSHCYSTSIISATCSHAVTIQCGFTEDYKSIDSSGSKQMCTIQSSTKSSAYDKYKAATEIAIPILSVLVVVLVIAVTYLAYKYRPRACRRRQQPDNQQPDDDQQPLQDNRPVGQGCFD